MNGFLPLVEAFLALALTMLALATAVSAIVGVWMRLFRWRALGLRQSVSLLYDKDIGPRLERIAQSDELTDLRVDFIAEMTFGLDLLSGADLGAERGQRLDELRASLEEPSSGGTSDGIRWLVRRFRRWRSLRLGVDYLTKTQFQSRLDASRAGQALSSRFTAQAWNELKRLFERSFDELGETATEAFARRARVRTVAVSLALAIGVNIDAFGLLNVYMIDPEIRRSVIAQQEAMLSQDAPVSNADQRVQGETGGDRSGFDSTIVQLKGRIAEAASIADRYGEDVDALRELQVVLEVIDNDVDTIAESKREFDVALSATRGIANQLTKSFPIGWDGYPNCYEPTLDARCALVYAQPQGADLQPLTFSARLPRVAEVDPASFAKWFLGILLSGFMVGLGAPFWIQFVNRLLKLKSHIRGEESDRGDKAQGGGAGGIDGAHDQASSRHVMSREALLGRAVRPTGEVARKSTDDWLAAQRRSSTQKKDV